MKTLTTTMAKKHDYNPRHDLYEYARVTDVQPIYREV
jgi:hypothetical protein